MPSVINPLTGRLIKVGGITHKKLSLKSDVEKRLEAIGQKVAPKKAPKKLSVKSDVEKRLEAIGQKTLIKAYDDVVKEAKTKKPLKGYKGDDLEKRLAQIKDARSPLERRLDSIKKQPVDSAVLRRVKASAPKSNIEEQSLARRLDFLHFDQPKLRGLVNAKKEDLARQVVDNEEYNLEEENIPDQIEVGDAIERIIRESQSRRISKTGQAKLQKVLLQEYLEDGKDNSDVFVDARDDDFDARSEATVIRQPVPKTLRKRNKPKLSDPDEYNYDDKGF